jgi:hypothetical protein
VVLCVFLYVYLWRPCMSAPRAGIVWCPLVCLCVYVGLYIDIYMCVCVCVFVCVCVCVCVVCLVCGGSGNEVVNALTAPSLFLAPLWCTIALRWFETPS